MRVVRAEGYDEPRDALAWDWGPFLAWALPEASWLPVPNLGDETVSFARQWGLDAIILSGGNDLGTEPRRDASERSLVEWCAATDRPVFGVCRGLQLMHSLFGGSLEPCAREIHVAARHPIRIDRPPTELPDAIEVNSFHGFGIREDRLASPLRAFAVSDDGWVEGAMHRRQVGIMWHPEREARPREFDRRLLRAALQCEEMGREAA